MSDEPIDLRQLVARLNTPRMQSYLVARGWEQKPSRYLDHVYFEVASDEADHPYELYLPESANVPNYQTRLMRAIYKLCGIEDREPIEIVQEVFAAAAATEQAVVSRHMKIRNSGTTPLQLRLDAPPREMLLLPGEGVELACDDAGGSGVLEINRDDRSLTLQMRGQP